MEGGQEFTRMRGQAFLHSLLWATASLTPPALVKGRNLSYDGESCSESMKRNGVMEVASGGTPAEVRAQI